MNNISFREIRLDEISTFVDRFGDYIERYGCLNFGEGFYALGAYDGETPVGFMSLGTGRLIPPLKGEEDAFVDAIEVESAYRRQGIARAMVAMAEDWARQRRFRQIRAWSSEDKVEAIGMWSALGYCLCPALMLGEDREPGAKGGQPKGYYVAKILH